MPTTYLTDFIAAIRYLIRDSTATYDFSDAEVQNIITHVIKEVSMHSPYRINETALLTANSKKLDISGISNLLNIDKVEYKPGQNPEQYRNYRYNDNETIIMDVSSAPSETGTSGTLTGTLTFTAGSATVTGAGTAFLTELAQDYFICRSDGSRWYRVQSVESDTSLTLDETVKTADTGADTINTTKYRYNVAVIHCEKLHTLTDAIKTLNPNEERVLTEGVTAYLLAQWVNKLRSQVNEAVTIITSLHSSTGDITSRLNKAISYLNQGEGLIDENRDTAKGILDEIPDLITKAQADLLLARDFINTVPIGSSPESDYFNSAGRNLNVASQKLGLVNGYLNVDNVSSQYAGYARTEIGNISALVSQVNGYAREIQSRLNIASIIANAQGKADRQMAIYKQALNEITPLKTYSTYSPG